MTETYKNFIGGRWTESRSGEVFPDINPANTDDVVGHFQKSNADDIKAAIEAAEAALPAWSALPAPTRGEILFKAADILRSRVEEIARLFTREEGKPIGEARAEVIRAAQILEFFGGEGSRMAGETLPSARREVFLFTIRQPLGVVAIITPWNFPIAIPAWKIAPALVAGNTVVFKPASLAPLTGLKLVEVLVEAGLPEGVLNFVTGPGSLAGSAMLQHPSIRAVSFTGSTEIGCQVYAEASKRTLRCQCEMGGKNPLVILDDCDLEKAVDLTVEGAFRATGQKCTATSRVIVQRSILQPYLDRLVEKTRTLKVGDGLEEDTYIGPLVDEPALQKVLRYIEVGKREGARLLFGGRRLTEGAYGKGYFVEPTIFADVKNEMTIAREEIFGPVVGIITVDSFEEAVKVANDTMYGLSASIVTRSINKAIRFMRMAEVGIVGVNVPTAGVEYQAPFGGTKASGSGWKEQGKVALDFYTEIKTVAIDPSE